MEALTILRHKCQSNSFTLRARVYKDTRKYLGCLKFYVVLNVLSWEGVEDRVEQQFGRLSYVLDLNCVCGSLYA